ncbi:uncharacterized protein TRIADDRAFT_53500 [Trichoplax adhaerens]|uniref:Cap-specific mRNA (nucleoside-2'-O-)-methyltransferase 2 n=1 Tax=Trichoplax adhaerens TaxID=10228 RepID=B3RPD9_TRIAD|nr:hypothetical protein TRIADDRAFT_53500 [Trichoplax adhaerens]EDV27618.1 hypothetical protein TRIADDRAFT_53500 [Trichoplax adhaerens]|eukprot:XP_002109452.1 hypothetical protein TRIADDRAFT_53500 [Trichoplax adhaerens]
MAKSHTVIGNCFTKEFTLKSNHDNLYNLLTLDCDKIFTTASWSLDQFSKLEKELNEIKSRLNDYDIKVWQQHTSYTNLAHDIVFQLKQQCYPELCTQAWAKFYEILHRCNIDQRLNLQQWSDDLDLSQIPLSSLHLCEGPGAFMTSFNHYLKSHYPHLPWQWLAMTLNPYYEGNKDGSTITDNRLISKTLSHWNFGRDNSGNILHRHNMTFLVESLSQWPSIRLVTADGSIDCSDRPGQQEAIVSPILYCETLTALRILTKDGVYVLKMFTSFQHRSICLIYLLLNVFQEVKAIKPSCSKSGNSEVYIICIGYIGFNAIPKQFWDNLCANYGLEDRCISLFPLDYIPVPIIDKIYTFCQYFSTLQIDAIQRNIRLFDTLNKSNRKFISKAKKAIAKEYITRYQVYEIQPEKKIVSSVDVNLSRRDDKFKSIGSKAGSFNQRVGQTKRKWSESVNDYNIPELLKIETAPCSSRFPRNRIFREEICNLQWLHICNSCFASNELLLDVMSVRQEQSRHKQEIKTIDNYQNHSLSPTFYSNSCYKSIADILLSVTKTGNQAKYVVLSGKVQHILSNICNQSGVSDDQVKVITTSNESAPCSTYFAISSTSELISSFDSCERYIQETFKAVDIVFADFHPESIKERASQTSHNKLILSEVLLACKVLAMNGHLILTVGDLLSRFQCSVVYMLHVFFNKHLQQTLSMVSILRHDEDGTNEVDLLCFVPISLLTDEGSEFYRYIYEINNRSLGFELAVRANKKITAFVKNNSIYCGIPGSSHIRCNHLAAEVFRNLIYDEV